MRWCQISLAGLALLVTLSLIAPGVAVAGSGPSASNNQYVDPLAGLTKHKTSSTTTPATTTPPTTPPSSALSSSAPSSIASTSTISPTTTAAADPARTLPYTGEEVWLVAALGLGLAGIGAALRRRGA